MRKLSYEDLPRAWQWHRCQSGRHVPGSRDRTPRSDHGADGAACYPQGVASVTWRQTQAAVGFAVAFTCTSSRRPWAMKTRT
jgi:hypothetical protein